MSAHLLINIGNTTTQIARSPTQVVAIPTHAADYGTLAESALGVSPSLWCISSVVPAANQTWKRLAEAHGSEARWVSPAWLQDVDTSDVEMSTVGADRIANIAGALALFKPPLIVLDCGTAITTEILLPGPRFAGGAIMPGRSMLREALATFTSQLPHVPMSSGCPPPIGTTTQSAILAGVDCGVLGTVEHILTSTKRQERLQSCPVLATGGDVDYFARNLTIISRVEKQLTLHGLAQFAAGITQQKRP